MVPINMISIKEEKQPDSKWNDRLVESGLGTIYQTKEMATYFLKIDKNPIFLKFVDDKDRIVGQLLFTEASRFEKKGMAKHVLTRIPHLRKTLYTWSYGPVIFNSQLNSDIYSALHDYLLSKNCSVSGWTHPLLSEIPKTFEKNFQIKEWSTFLIDLEKPIDVLYNNIEKHNGRKNIERSKKRGVKIEEITDDSLLEYYHLRNQMREDAGIEKMEFPQLSEWWNLLKPIGYSGFLAKKDDTVVGGLLFSYFNGHIIEGGVARSLEDYKSRLYSQDLIKWKIIEWGHENKMKYYNLAGFNPHPQSKKEEGIKRYKTKWGGRRYDYWNITK